jgi:hypothetical protein
MPKISTLEKHSIHYENSLRKLMTSSFLPTQIREDPELYCFARIVPKFNWQAGEGTGDPDHAHQTQKQKAGPCGRGRDDADSHDARKGRSLSIGPVRGARAPETCGDAEFHFAVSS